MKLINYKSPEGHVLSDFRINSWGHLKKITNMESTHIL